MAAPLSGVFICMSGKGPGLREQSTQRGTALTPGWRSGGLHQCSPGRALHWRDCPGGGQLRRCLLGTVNVLCTGLAPMRQRSATSPPDAGLVFYVFIKLPLISMSSALVHAHLPPVLA